MWGHVKYFFPLAYYPDLTRVSKSTFHHNPAGALLLPHVHKTAFDVLLISPEFRKIVRALVFYLSFPV
jgi:hypothetical protein